MIEIKKEKKEKQMIKILNIIIFLIVITFINSNTVAETKPDCSQYSTKTYLGLLDNIRCKKGLPVEVRKKPKKFSDLNPLKPKDESGKVIENDKLTCHEYSTKTYTSTKTLTGLITKLRCEKKLKHN